jgi:hypothetical protein
MDVFSLRGFEMNSTTCMWEWNQVRRAMEIMERTEMNALIFHHNELVDKLVLPSAYFSEEYMWTVNPPHMHQVMSNRHYIGKLVRALKRRGMQFYVEVKELGFMEPLTKLRPDIWRKGSPCPFNPFWWEFLEAKYTELFERLPDIAGVIVSPGTRESKVSYAANAEGCDCPDCHGKTAVDWYTELLAAMYKPMKLRGKTLVVRDFSYSAKNQRSILDAAGRVSKDIVIAMKDTPHDYYPTFPDNAAIGNCPGHRQWVEFDTWGQFFGMGVFPCSVVEDMQERMRHCAKNGVDGVWARTDWEGITESSVLNSFQTLNIFGLGLLGRDPDRDLDEVYKAWCDFGILSPMKSASEHQLPVRPTAPDAWKRLKDFMIAGWKVIEKSQYVRGHVFNEDDQYCNSVKRSLDMMLTIHGRDDWEPGASRLVEPTQENIDIIMEEKRQAVEEVEQLEGILDVDSLGVCGEFVAECKVLLELCVMYVRGFQYCAQGVFYALKYKKGHAASDKKMVEDAGMKLASFIAEIDAAFEGTDYPHYIYWLLDQGRLRELAADLRAYIR